MPGLLVQADYFIVQSRRMFTNHQRLPETYPITANFYDQLFSKDLGFVKIKDFNSFPKLTINHRSLTIDDEFAEETLSVFDHPVIRVYEKIKPLIKTDYEKLLKI